jgi:hypothetical protein
MAAAGPGHAEARDRDHHDPRVDLAHHVVADAPPLQAARPHGLDHGIRVADQVEEDLAPLLGPQV